LPEITLIIDGEPWFIAADVCKALEHTNVTMALDRLDDDEKAKFGLGLTGGDTNIVNEPGLYTLVLGSRKPEAKALKRHCKAITKRSTPNGFRECANTGLMRGKTF
jgi:prophage antirepressor-like protein